MNDKPDDTSDQSISAKSDGAQAIDPQLLSLLVCPLTKQPLEFDRDNCELVSRAANLAYPVRGGIAIMLPSEARALDETG